MTTDATAGADTATDGTDTSTTDTGSTTGEQSTDTGDGADKWKALARQHERESKAARRELDQLRQQHMTDNERELAKARTEGLSEGLKQGSTRLIRSEFKVAAVGRNVDLDALLEGRDLSPFADEDGEPDTKAIAAWLDKVAPKATTTDDDDGAGRQQSAPFDLGQGTRTSSAMALNGDPLMRDLKSKLGIR